MEAATPLRAPNVRILGDRLIVDGLVIDDDCAVRMVRERVEGGGDPVRAVADALEIGARVLDREQAGANVELVRSEMEKASREIEASFMERAAAVSDVLEGKLDEAFGPETGAFSRALQRHFSDGSSEAVQHRVRALVGETMAQARQDLQRQFSAADGNNPLADFKAASLAMMKRSADQQDAALRGLLEKLAALELEVTKLHGERDKQLELAIERERGTAKGRTFEEEVFEAVDAIALAQGDDAEAVGDLKGSTRKTGDAVVAIDGCSGPARGRIVFEAKASRLSRPEALRELDRGMAERGADYAVLVVPDDERMPARTHPLREYNGDKLLVAYSPEDGSRVALEVAYALARARVLMARGGDEGIDPAAVGDVVERALGAMEDVRKVKLQLTGASTSIENARSVLDAMADRVRGHLEEIARLLAAAEPTSES